MSRWGVMRLGVIVVLAASALVVQVSPAGAALLRSETEWVDGYDEFGGFTSVKVLSRITYTEGATAAKNEVSYEPLFAAGPSVCWPFGPGPSPCLETVNAEEHVFLDRTATISRAVRRCRAVDGVLGLCDGPSANSADVRPEVDPALPVEIELGRKADRFEAIVSDPPSETAVIAISVTGGPGNDVIDLIDRTASGRESFPGSGADRIACGTGTDSVTTTPATEVAPDCERITRVG